MGSGKKIQKAGQAGDKEAGQAGDSRLQTAASASGSERFLKRLTEELRADPDVATGLSSPRSGGSESAKGGRSRSGSDVEQLGLSRKPSQELPSVESTFPGMARN